MNEISINRDKNLNNKFHTQKVVSSLYIYLPNSPLNTKGKYPIFRNIFHSSNPSCIIS